MKYMLLIYGNENCWTEEERQACMLESMGVCQDLEVKGKFVAASPLHSVATATSLQIRGGQKLITDGPFAETTEQLGGYYIIDVDDLDEALEIAARLPPAKKGTVEIRPVFDVARVSEVSDCDIVSSRELKFSREEVFAAIADPERLARWWGPAGFTNTFHEFDFHPGGNWRFIMHGPDGKDYENHNVFESIVRPDLISLQHVCPPQFHMTMTLTALLNGGTRIHWRQRFADAQIRNAVAKFADDANEQNFDRLTAELQRGADGSAD